MLMGCQNDCSLLAKMVAGFDTGWWRAVLVEKEDTWVDDPLETVFVCACVCGEMRDEVWTPREGGTGGLS
jgi:hypothetical protein